MGSFHFCVFKAETINLTARGFNTRMMKALTVGIVLAIFATMATTEGINLSKLERSSSMNCFLLCITNKNIPMTTSAISQTYWICKDLCAIENKDDGVVRKYITHLRKYEVETFHRPEQNRNHITLHEEAETSRQIPDEEAERRRGTQGLWE